MALKLFNLKVILVVVGISMLLIHDSSQEKGNYYFRIYKII